MLPNIEKAVWAILENWEERTPIACVISQTQPSSQFPELVNAEQYLTMPLAS
jgi:hypothetical protein